MDITAGSRPSWCHGASFDPEAQSMAGTVRARNADNRAIERPPPKVTPARTTDELAARLLGLCEKIDRRLNKGQRLTIEETRQITKRLRGYAIRLRAAPTQFNLY
jgi:hypothetical protein